MLAAKRCVKLVFGIRQWQFKIMKINSIIFHTTRLNELRDFYEGKLGLSVGTYVKENKTVPDCSDSYVNYHLDGILLCFEYEEGRTDKGTIVVNVPDLEKARSSMEQNGVAIVAGKDFYFKIKDPEGRSIIVEQVR